MFQIARELRLRDIGGIIVVDFIDMADDCKLVSLPLSLPPLLECPGQRMENIWIAMSTFRKFCKSVTGFCSGTCTFWP